MTRKAISLLIIAAVIITMFPNAVFAEGETGGTQFILNYDANGGEGTVPETVTQYENTTASISDGNGLASGGLVFWKWNTQPGGTGKDYFPGDVFAFTADTTLYALYIEPVHVSGISLNSKTERMVVGSKITLTAEVLPEDASYKIISWTSSNEAVAAVDQSGLVTAVSEGTAIITATADEMTDICSITVVADEFSVAFNTQGGNEINSVNVPEGGIVAVPAVPVRDGFSFEGWYKEQACIIPWDFDTDTVTGGVTLYAEWRKDGCAFSGSGTPENPYRITSASELAELSSLVNAGDALYFDKCYIQTQDIDLSGYENWTPIGIDSNKPFQGTYNGNEKSIENISINICNMENTYIYVGLFGYVRGVIENICIKNGEIFAKGNYYVYFGSVAGYIKNTSLENCSAQGMNVSLSDCNFGYVGGIVGYTENSVILGCKFSGIINGYGRNPRAGGITGRINEGTCIRECYNVGEILAEGTQTSYSSGITAFAYAVNTYCTVEECFNLGNIISKGGSNSLDNYAAGITGYLYKSNISNCYNIGKVISQSLKQNDYTGGIIGHRYQSGNVSTCYNLGYLSGINCGGIAGDNTTLSNFISNCYYADTCAAAVGNGTGTASKKSLEEMRQQSTFSGFDFDTVWTLDEQDSSGYDYPQLKNNPLKTREHEVLLNANSEQGYTEGSGSYGLFDTVMISAHPCEHYVFKNWVVTSGGAVLTDPSSMAATFTMPETDVSIEAVFEKQKYTLTVESAENGTASGGGSYAWGDIIPVTASANSGYQFMRWEVVSGQAEISDYYDMTVDVALLKSDTTIRAVFVLQPTEYTYTVTDEKATITDYSGAGGAVSLPGRLGGYWVKSIAYAAFSGKDCITSLTIPDSVETIEDLAFSECPALTDVNIGTDIRDIGALAFNNCISLRNITVSEENDFYKSTDGVVYNKTGTELICCPPGRRGIFTVPEGVETIHEAAFYHCVSLTEIDIPETVISIEKSAFNYCANLTDIVIPDSVTSIGESAFRDCLKLKTVDLPSNLSEISGYMFYGCYALQNVIVPDAVTVIGNSAFYSCTSLEYVIFNEDIERIGERAFSKCRLSSVYIPESLLAMGENAFSDNTALTGAYFFGSPQMGLDVFSNAAGGFKIYYHVSNASEWASYSAYPKKAFCVVTWAFQNGQPDSNEIVIADNFVIPQPREIPVWEGYTFKGWYKEEACANAWNFNKDTVDGNITLYAKWEAGPFEVTVSPNNALYGYVFGGGVYSLGDTAALSAVPKDGCRFIGWYTNGVFLSSRTDYSFTVSSGCTYVAMFEEIGIPEISAANFTGNGSINVEWTPVAGAYGYEIWRCETSDGDYEKIGETRSTSYTDSRFTMKTTYYYMVSAYCMCGSAKASGEQSDYVSQIAVMPVPLKIAADSAGYESIKISWDEVKAASGYEIYRATTKSGSYSLVYTTPSVSYTDKKLKTGTTYYYKVLAYNDKGTADIESDFSEAVFCTPVPQRVAGLCSSAYSATSVKLSWNTVPGKSGYEIWRSTSPDKGFSLIKTVSGTSFSDNTVKPNTPYYYMVRAYRNAGRKPIPGDFSEAVSAETVLSSVTDLTVQMCDPTSIKVSWNAVKGCKGYDVERSEYPDKDFKVIKTTGSTYYKDTGRTTNTRYYYRVCAYVMAGSEKVRTDYSKVMSDVPVLGKVAGVKASVCSPTKIKISWGAVQGKSGYEILRSGTSDGKYDVIGFATGTYYNDSGREPNKTYYYKVRAYRTIGGARKYGNESEYASATPVLGSAAEATASAYSPSKNMITWRAVAGRSGYEVYRSETSAGGFVYIGSTANTYYYDSKNVAGKTYYYSVRAFVMIGSIKFYTDYSNVSCVVRMP